MYASLLESKGTSSFLFCFSRTARSVVSAAADTLMCSCKPAFPCYLATQTNRELIRTKHTASYIR